MYKFTIFDIKGKNLGSYSCTHNKGDKVLKSLGLDGQGCTYTCEDKVNKTPIIERVSNSHRQIDEMGCYGNVWVRKLTFPTKDVVHEGHEHEHPHVSLLASGAVTVEVEGEPTTQFTAPTFITIAANKEHKITALEDNTVWFCVFAVRDKDGEVTDFYDGDNSPYNQKKGE